MISRSRAGLFACTTGAAVILGLLWGRPSIHREALVAPKLSINPAQLLADGRQTALLTVEGRPHITITENPRSATVDPPTQVNGQWQAQIRAGVTPAPVVLRVEVPGLLPATATLTLTPNNADTFEDGTPDFLRLDDEHDRESFRRWFTWLAEAQYFQPPANRASDINDCAALIRYAYRESLRTHESGWAESARVPIVPAFSPIEKYRYPYTPLGAALFRVQPGPFRAADLTSRPGPFAQFADAQTLWRYNTYRISRDLARALPGDLLFFRHEVGRMPFHSMIWLGESPIRRDGNRYILYHTGPDGRDPGEIRRLTLPELLRYPQPEWRPVRENPAFLGVFRWNILRKAFEP